MINSLVIPMEKLDIEKDQKVIYYLPDSDA